MDNTIPKVVLEEAEQLIQVYGKNIIKIGSENIWDVYKFNFPKNSLVGFPFLFMHNTENDAVITITNFDALDMINHLNTHNK